MKTEDNFQEVNSVKAGTALSNQRRFSKVNRCSLKVGGYAPHNKRKKVVSFGPDAGRPNLFKVRARAVRSESATMMA